MEKDYNKIHIKDLNWKAGYEKITVLDNINAVLEKGHFYGILGPNGAGKTSLIRNMINFVNPTAGIVYFGETEVAAIPRKELSQNISFLPQSVTNLPDFTVEEMVAMGREPYRSFARGLDTTDKEKINEALEFTDCHKFRHKSFVTLSGGERQRVMIARTVAQDTPWIILDEPISNLDIRHQLELMKIFDTLRKEKGKTIIAIIHDINIAYKFCDKIILMKDGNIIRMGDTAEVINYDNLLEVFGVGFDFVKCDDNKVVVTPEF